MQQLLVLLVALLLMSCGGEKKGTPETANTKTLETEAPEVSQPEVDIRQRELDSGIRNDTIYLKYRLGMSREAFEAHSKAMADSGKFYSVTSYLKNNKPLPIYLKTNFPYRGMSEMKYTFDDNDRLYSITLNTKQSKLDWEYDELVELYKLSYGEPDNIVTLDPKNGPGFPLKVSIYEWFDGNREIKIGARKFMGDIIVYVNYTDMANDYDPYAKYNEQPLEKSDDI